jgi:pterin-4a-carbinolamine dehydratase
VAEELHGRLPRDVTDMLSPAGEPPRRAASTRPEVPTELSDEEIARRLRTLTGWTGDHTGISRSVRLPVDRVTPLVDRVQREARTMNDHAHVERHPDGVTFHLRTGPDGVVTEPDLSLAARIDEAVADIGSGGRPGR